MNINFGRLKPKLGGQILKMTSLNVGLGVMGNRGIMGIRGVWVLLL